MHPILRLTLVPMAAVLGLSVVLTAIRPDAPLPGTAAAGTSHPHPHRGALIPAQPLAPPVLLGQRSGPFTATVLQGPEQGWTLTGTLQLQVWTHGTLTGTLLRPHRAPVPVQGQLKGQLIGLFFNLGPGKNIFGNGVIGYDRFQKRSVIGGTFTGPSATATGVWGYTVADFCTTGIIYGTIRGSGQLVCYTVDED